MKNTLEQILRFFLILLFVFSFQILQAQEIPTLPSKPTISHVKIGTTVNNETMKLTLVARMQSYQSANLDEGDVFDRNIHSPKSVNILEKSGKFYVHSLEGSETIVYDLATYKKIKVIKHKFHAHDGVYFLDTTLFDYTFRTRNNRFNIFSGKPVESCFTHNGKYLWVTYYRRDFDKNAVDPSAVCIINTETDQIVRVMPTAPLPKMIACSPGNDIVAVTHWGDNTVGLIDVSSALPSEWKYTNLLEIGKRATLKVTDEKVDRDNNCGWCLRGTVFTPDSNYLLIAEMGGMGIGVVDLKQRKYLGTVSGSSGNVRHLVINNGNLYLSSNKYGRVEKTNLADFEIHIANSINKSYSKWKSTFVGSGARTISVSADGKYILAAVNVESKLVLLDAITMKVLLSIPADSYPVGLDITDNASTIFVTAQGKTGGGGNSVMVYKLSVVTGNKD